ncbi:MAG TPA: hypothetical protein VMS30_05205 [Phycisphaerales bacterium]|nr:hypothetical protein [Phycisphaerales bacterium]
MFSHSNNTNRYVTFATRLAAALALLAMPLQMTGCIAAHAIGAMGAAEEAQKLVETMPRYRGLENKTVAVVVEADYSTMFEYPNLVTYMASGVTMRIARWVPGVQVLDPSVVLNWQYNKPNWNALPYGEIAEQLNVDRVVFIEVLEYRLHPPGNRFLWDGNAVSRVGIIERKGIDPDTFAETFDVAARFPAIEGVTAENATQTQIETGLLVDLVKRNAWLFHLHYEPKHPTQYRAELDTKEMRELKQKTGS